MFFTFFYALPRGNFLSQEGMPAVLMAVGALLTSAVVAVPGNTHYFSNEELAEYLSTTAYLRQDIASLYSIGSTLNSAEIPVLELSAADPSEQVPNVKFVGGIHGDEAISSQILVSFIEFLVDGYTREERFVKWLLNNTRLHILPRLNLDGFELAIEGICQLGPGRENILGHDINRMFISKPSDLDARAPEAEAVKSWLKDTVFTLSASVLGGELVAIYPPDNIPEHGGERLNSDEDVFKHLASSYARNHAHMSQVNGCDAGNKFNEGTINGAAWYPVKGTMSDYNFEVGIMELSLEINCCKYPLNEEIDNIWEENQLALLKFAAESCRGVRGKVTAYGEPVIGASVAVLGRNMTVRTNDNGYYFRVLLPGRYFIKVESFGLKTEIKEFFVPQSDTAFLKWTVLDVQLVMEDEPEPTHGVGSNVSDPTEPQDGHTMSYDRGGLDPEDSPTYDDLYLTSTDGSSVRSGPVTASSPPLKHASSILIYICILCTFSFYI